MKALTLHEPWAWFVAKRWKEVETRGWYTAYRGPLAIHAGKKHDKDGIELWTQFVTGTHLPADFPEFDQLPFGCVVATCSLVACLPTNDVEDRAQKLQQPFAPPLGWETEKEFGNYAPGRWAFILRDVIPMDPPIPAHGWQQLWNWTPTEVTL